MEESSREINVEHQGDKQVYLNAGTLQIILVVDSRQDNRILMASLFEHMGKWFEENAQFLADNPEMEGSSWRLHEDIIVVTNPEHVGDTFPVDWLEEGKAGEQSPE